MIIPVRRKEPILLKFNGPKEIIIDLWRARQVEFKKMADQITKNPYAAGHGLRRHYLGMAEAIGRCIQDLEALKPTVRRRSRLKNGPRLASRISRPKRT